MLDSRFFKRITTRAHHDDGCVFEAYEAVYARSTMVLFSRKTKTPLAALTLKAEEDQEGCWSMLTGRPSPQGAMTAEPYFQGTLNKSDQVFDFTISNLSDEGWINFNVLHTPHCVASVDPGPAYGVNRVNELRENQSYTIPADQRTNCKMVLKGKTQRIITTDSSTGQKSQDEVPLTVKDSEETNNNENSDTSAGLYFYLSVVPDKSCQNLVDKFSEGTIWKVAPGFVRRLVTSSSLGDSDTEMDLDSPEEDSDTGIDLRPRATGFVLYMLQGFYGGDDDDDDYGCSSRFEHLRGRTGLIDFRDDDEEVDMMLSGGAGADFPVLEVGRTQAAELQYGSRVEVVSGGSSGHNYAYEHCSEPTVLCMSIWTGMKFLVASPPSTSMESELNQEIDEWIQN